MSLIKCPECGKEISDKAKSCPGCGCPIDAEVHNVVRLEQSAEKDEKKRLFTLKKKSKDDDKKKPEAILSIFSIFLIIFLPLAVIVAIADLIINRKDKERSHLGSKVSLIICILILIVIILNQSNNTEGTMQNNDENEYSIESTILDEAENLYEITETEIGNEGSIDVDAVVFEEDPLLVDLRKIFSEEFALQIIDIIRNQIGFVDVEFLEKLGDTSNYSLMADGVSIVMTAYEEDEYIRIFTPNGGGVYYEDGNVLLTAEEKLATVISWEDRIVYYIMAEDIIKNNLKSPNSAKFASLYSGEITMQKKDEIVGVSSYVDAILSLTVQGQ